MKSLLQSGKLSHVAVLSILLAGVTSLDYVMQSQPVHYALAQNDSADSAQLQAANVTGELTRPAGGNPYGGEKIGDIAITSDGHQTNIKGLVSASPAEENVYEAWLHDAGGWGYQRSLRQRNKEGTINFSQHTVHAF